MISLIWVDLSRKTSKMRGLWVISKDQQMHISLMSQRLQKKRISKFETNVHGVSKCLFFIHALFPL